MTIPSLATDGPVLVGDRARSVYLQDVTGNVVSLAQYRGQMVLLCLYRSPDCPQCGVRLLRLKHAYSQLQAQGVAVVVVFEAPQERVRYHTAPLFLPFPLVADPERRVFQSYGVRSPWWGLVGVLRIGAYWQAWRARAGGRITSGHVTQRPADVLIGPDGLVLCAYYGRDIGDHLSVAAVVEEAHAPSRCSRHGW